MSNKIKNKREYLNPKTVAKLNSIALRARLIVEGYIIGQHQSPYHGFSVEFAEHKAFGIGDEIRHIDWKLYGKTDRLYVKRFQEETNLRAYIILDTSSSMIYSSDQITKLEYANTLAAALSYLMIKQQDGVGLIKFSNKLDTFIHPKSKPSHLNVILNKLNDQETGSETNIKFILGQIAERLNKRGLIILISDLIDEPENVIKGLKHIRHKNQEIIVFHISDEKELSLDFGTRTTFVDLETKSEIKTDPWQIKDTYEKLLKDLRKYYSNQCNKNHIDYVPLTTKQGLDIALTEYLKKRTRLN